ncbi:hypothetical protein GF339_00065 [candidate division KSB3 bacterium]|uniref:Flippase-like domain-containing protein n=1 Tax=candidate division KSB3 bacterium TaxID=2044937 RepID=A0A9D5JRQ6_9BACT|nr:hypothetical protein [candidate division KSB3 bacterium]
MRNTPYKKIFHVLAGIVLSLSILYFLLRKVDINIFLAKFADIDWSYYGIIVGLYLLRTFLRSLRFSLVTRTGMKDVYMISAIHAFLNTILPLRSGELTWPVLMKKYTNVSFGNSVTLLLVLRYLDILCVILLFTGASFIVRPAFMNRPMYFLLGCVLIMQVVCIIYGRVFIKIIVWVEKKIAWPFVTDKLEKVKNIFRQFQHYIHPAQTYWQIIGILGILTLLNWLTMYAIFSYYIRMFHIEFAFIHVIIGASFVTLGSNLPINSFGKFGTFELTWAAGFILLGMSKDIAVPLGLFINVSNTVLSCSVALIGYINLTLSARLGRW